MFDIIGDSKQDLIRLGIKPRKKTIYEKICILLEQKVSIPVPRINEEKLQEAINFCHLEITPKGPVIFSFLFTSLLSLFFLMTTLIGMIPIPFTIIFFICTFGLGYHILNYPHFYSVQYKIKASSEMVLAVVYMTVSMKIKSNLEAAVIFAASNLRGPLGVDLGELVWDVFNGKYFSFNKGLDAFIKKWKFENREFTQALNLIKSSLSQGIAERESSLNEAVRTVLDGTKSSMRRYSREMDSSLKILNALGILLPIIGLMFFPMLTIFMPDAVKPIAIAIGYDVLLPLVVFFLMMSFLKKRPATFHQPEVLEERKKTLKKILDKNILIPVLITLVISGFGLFSMLRSTEQFSFKLLMFSLLVIVGTSLGISVHCFMSSIPKLKKKDKIIEMENELHMVLFQIGHQLKSGGSIENNILQIKNRIQELKIMELFRIIVNNIQMFGMTFKQATFNTKNGAIYEYPSYLISAMLKAISDISYSGTSILSDSILSISSYLKNMREIEEYLEDILSEVTSTMRIQSLILAPIASGIVVALAAMMMHMLVNLSEWVVKFQEQMQSYGPIGTVGGTAFNSILTIDKILPVSYFQLIVGIYMIEVVVMITLFLSIIKYGDEKIQRKYDIGMSLLTALGIYSITVIVLYLILTSLITLSTMGFG